MHKTKTKHKGVPVGYKHHWYYKGGTWNEQKVAPRTWKFRYTSSKSRSGGRGGPQKGFNVVWKINAIQKAIKVSPRKYLTTMIGTKKQLSYKLPKRKRHKY